MEERRKTIVVASMKKEDTSWLSKRLLDWDKKIYIVDDPSAELTVPLNKGHEAMVYLTYIIDHYDSLPPYMVFIHAQRYQWHNDDPVYDLHYPLLHLQLPHVEEHGYANLRCTWLLGCPAEIYPKKQASLHPYRSYNLDGNITSYEAYLHAFRELFPGKKEPDEIGVSCCAQFAVTKEKVRERKRAEYERYRNWLLETPLPDDVSGRILEYSWHMIFGKPPVYCPNAPECYCKMYGLCGLNCPTERSCVGRYNLPT
ncbi:hypothetical protein BDY21DRAFT_290462 [Lineolata rhizophorae]|uniref:DUF3431 domain-containing protein n=1 Tax=Lineolata rhizophorae TaxID=578093 RepID=A0A6A6NU32_9PEZI|nr:hypothetical protein BDY21DRAFT_290462 [Lineolata rhizophorae]